ncbi:MAG: hypothetical protein JWP27_717 [Flaviaesturariibacter sp.]|nr:hypothetical protein [Flaviaesturariibacter sp.]
MKRNQQKRGSDREHFMVCPHCRQEFDMRDLNAVFSHEHSDAPMPEVPFTHAEKRPATTAFYQSLRPLTLN